MPDMDLTIRLERPFRETKVRDARENNSDRDPGTLTHILVARYRIAEVYSFVSFISAPAIFTHQLLYCVARGGRQAASSILSEVEVYSDFERNCRAVAERSTVNRCPRAA